MLVISTATIWLHVFGPMLLLLLLGGGGGGGSGGNGAGAPSAQCNAARLPGDRMSSAYAHALHDAFDVLDDPLNIVDQSTRELRAFIDGQERAANALPFDRAYRQRSRFEMPPPSAVRVDEQQQQPYDIETNEVDQQLYDSNAIEAGPEKRVKPSLSISNSLDVLRQQVMLDFARRQMRENFKQIEMNRAHLNSIGKRSGRAKSPFDGRRHRPAQFDTIRAFDDTVDVGDDGRIDAVGPPSVGGLYRFAYDQHVEQQPQQQQQQKPSRRANQHQQQASNVNREQPPTNGDDNKQHRQQQQQQPNEIPSDSD